MQRRGTLSNIIPTSLEWKNLSVHAKNGKQLVSNADGVVNPGEMLAIMGSSGAGKTTLLNTLSSQGVTSDTRFTGEITVNGNVIGQRIADISAFCQQEDLYIGALTVREHLKFHAALRNVEHMDERIDQVIREMGLTKCADTRIGTSGRDKTISGGERKRLSFGTQILVQPAILFCDEPTSGLDSHLAHAVVKSLLNISKKGTTILCTIHQPSSDTFHLFNKLLLLSHGKTVYFGKSQDHVMEYFEKVLFKPNPANYNPADHYIQAISSQDPGKSTVLNQKFVESYVYDQIKSEMLSISHTPPLHNVRRSTSLWNQFKNLLWRSVIMTYRDPLVFIARIAQAVGVGLVLSAIYYRTANPYIGYITEFNNETNSYNPPRFHETVQQVNGALFSITAVMSMNYVFYVITVFPLLSPIWRIEYYSRLYNIPVAFLAANLAELPLLVCIPLLFCAPTYWLMGFYPDIQTFFTFFGIITLMSNTALSFGLMGSSLSDNVQVVTEMVPGLMLPLLCFGGFVLPLNGIPGWIRWARYLSWFTFTTEATSIIQWRNINFDCEIDGELIPHENCPPQFQLKGTTLIESMGFNEDNYWFDIVMLLVQLVVYRLIALLIVTLKFYFGSKGPSFKEKFSGKSISDKFGKLFRKKVARSDNFGLDSGRDYVGMNQSSMNESSVGMTFDSSNNSQTNVKISLDYANDGFESREARNVLENVLD